MLSKAFNSVNFDLLTHKLINLHLSETAVSWFESYLRERQQCVVSGNRSSSWLNITPDRINDAIDKLNKDIDSIVTWTKKFHLNINPGKTQAIILGHKQQTDAVKHLDISPLKMFVCQRILKAHQLTMLRFDSYSNYERQPHNLDLSLNIEVENTMLRQSGLYFACANGRVTNDAEWEFRVLHLLGFQFLTERLSIQHDIGTCFCGNVRLSWFLKGMWYRQATDDYIVAIGRYSPNMKVLMGYLCRKCDLRRGPKRNPEQRECISPADKTSTQNQMNRQL
ncbi:hypothetical protein ANN_14516 [Periplaneta americana]|uniref:Reverse transcriptase domain-containing protein n=1 Tax=Periplaneta americana TaxID=6978 RepID=A0ABQ8SWF7_PERAM|nr:hypothetical protein ANN_14516 [Periplaneta americana]